MGEKRGLVYTAKDRQVANAAGAARERFKNPLLGLEEFNNILKGKDTRKQKTLKLVFNYDDVKNAERITNPELRGAKNAKEFFEKFLINGQFGGDRSKFEKSGFDWKKLNKTAQERFELIFKNLGEDTHIFRGDIKPENIVGGKGYKSRTMKDVLNYIKNNPGRFGKEAAKVGASALALGYAGKTAYDMYNRYK